MVGFNSAIKPTHQTPKLIEEEHQPIEIEDLTFPLLDPLISFDFVDDWIVDNDSVNMSFDGSEVKSLDFDDGKVRSMIEQEMGKVSLVGGEESLNLGDALLKESGVGVIDEVLGEVHSAVKVDYECLDELKENGQDVVTIKTEDGIVSNNAESRDVSREEEEESSSSDSESESESESGSSGMSSSCSSSSSEEGDDEEEVDAAVEIEEGEIKDIDVEEMLAGSDEDEFIVKGPIKSKNEIEFLPPVPPVDVKLELHHQALPVGVVLSIMDAKVVVEGLEKHNPLNEGSILWVTESRSPLGIVDEIFGPVKNPFYIVRYNSDKEIPAGICQGTPVSFVTDFADYVLNDKNLYKKGYDASGENDEEIFDEVEFSDDEKEAEYRRAQKMANKNANDRMRGNQEFVARKKVQQQNGSWKNTQPPAQAFAKHTGQTNNRSQSRTPPIEPAFNGGSMTCSFSPGQVSSGGPFLAPPGSQVAHANCPQNIVPANGGVNCCAPQNFVPANGGWTNGMPGQLQQHMVFPNGYAMNGMPIQPLNHYQQAPQVFNGFPNGMPFQQQFNLNQMMMHNVPLPYGQTSFPPMPSSPWQWHPGQPNQAQFGIGLQGHPVHSPVNAGNQQGTSNGQDNVQSTEMLPPSNMQGNVPVNHQQNQGRPPTQGGRSYCRGGGGGRFSGRRGRQ